MRHTFQRTTLHLIPFFIFFFFASCEKEILQPTAPSSSSRNSEATLSKTKTDSSLQAQSIGPLRPLQCGDGGYRVYTNGGWEPTNQYRPAPGKYVGVMDDGNMTRNQNYFTQDGCSMVFGW